jgi:hypothetical protein
MVITIADRTTAMPHLQQYPSSATQKNQNHHGAKSQMLLME